MSAKRLAIALILFAALVLPSGAPPVQAQPPAPTSPAGGPWLSSAAELTPPGPDQTWPASRLEATPPEAFQAPNGDWIMPAGAGEGFLPVPLGAAIQPTGGPDDFGYTFASTPLNWIDASGGTNTGISASIVSAGPIDIGFPFKYYENSYSQLWVSRHGFLAFNDRYLYKSQSQVPSAAWPDDVIAPHWIPSYDSPGYVRYLRGGAAPNRWFVMEWNRQRSTVQNPGSEFTFQAVLHENGDILFQYRTMHISGGYFCMASGIEDSTGADGLSITNFCSPVASNQAVRITRPAPAARVRIFPQHYGAFFYPGETTTTRIPIRNIGELGVDTYNITVASSWLASLTHEDGVTPLTDTDGDGTIDTGPVAQGATKSVVLKIWTAATAQVGNTNTTTLTARSTRNSNVQRTATSRIAVPAPFVQVYRDAVDGAMSMQLVKPQSQAVRKATSGWHWGANVTVAELPNHNLIYVWSKGRCLDKSCTRFVSEIEYTILNPYGEIVRPVARLIDHSGATFDTYDYPSGVAATPDGRIGVVWYRYLWNSSTGQSNYNVHWAILDATGALAVGPTNLTNNTVWGAGSDLNVPRFSNPRIADTGNYRFVVAWQREHQESAGLAGDIWYAVISNAGDVVRSPSRLTNGSAGSSAHRMPVLASLTANRTFLSWITRRNGNDDVYFAVLNSEGGLVQGATDLSVDETVSDGGNYDAAQLSDGKILAVWEAWGCFPGEWTPRIRYVLLDSAYNRIGTPKCLERSEAATTGDASVSVAQGPGGLAVLTWMDQDLDTRRNLYYALVNSNGVVVTPATIFQTSRAMQPSIYTSSNGNTTYSWIPPNGVDSMLSVAPVSAYATPNGMATPIGVTLRGRGGLPATSVRLVATLDPHLRYFGDTSGIAPTVSGQTVTWTLPNLRLFDIRQFQIYLEATGGALGDRLPVALQLTSAEADLTPADNQATVQVWLSQSTYLPLLIRQ